MPYSLVSAMGLPLKSDAKWEPVDTSVINIQSLLRTYQDVTLTLTHPVLVNAQGQLLQRWVGLRFLLNTMGNYSSGMTLSQYLSSLGDLTLPVNDKAPDYTERPVRFVDATSAGYKLHPIDRTKSFDPAVFPVQPASSRDDQHDLLVTHPSVNLNLYTNRLMMSVNGLLHRVATSAQGPIVLEGGRTSRMNRYNQAGIFSFMDVGAVQQYPIVPAMLHRPAPDVPYRDAIHLECPVNLTNKTVFLVLGGFLIAHSKFCRRIGDQLLRIQLGDYPLPERLYFSRNKIDISSLQIPTAINQPTHWAVDDIFSDQTLLRLLLLSQSFLVIVDTPQMYIRMHPVEQSKIPGTFFTNFPVPRLPLVGPHGSFCEYLVDYEDGVQVLLTLPTEEPEFNFNTTGWRGATSIDDKVSTIHPHRPANVAMLELGKYGTTSNDTP